MPPAIQPVDQTERAISRAHKDLDELSQKFRRERLWGRVLIAVEFEDGRGVAMEVTPLEKRLARKL